MFNTTDDLLRVMLAMMPAAEIGEDNDGQIVVYTGLRNTTSGIIDFDDDTSCAQCGGLMVEGMCEDCNYEP